MEFGLVHGSIYPPAERLDGINDLRSRRPHRLVRIGLIYLLDFKLVYLVNLIGIKPITATPKSLFGCCP